MCGRCHGYLHGSVPHHRCPENNLKHKLASERERQLKGRKEVLSRFRRRNHRDSASSSDDEQPLHLRKDPDASSEEESGDEPKGPLLPWQLAKRQAGVYGVAGRTLELGRAWHVVMTRCTCARFGMQMRPPSNASGGDGGSGGGEGTPRQDSSTRATRRARKKTALPRAHHRSGIPRRTIRYVPCVCACVCGCVYVWLCVASCGCVCVLLNCQGFTCCSTGCRSAVGAVR